MSGKVKPYKVKMANELNYEQWLFLPDSVHDQCKNVAVDWSQKVFSSISSKNTS